MPRRTFEDVIAHADDLAKRFEDYEPVLGTGKDARSLRDIAAAFEDAARAQERLAGAVSVARAEGHSWAAIGSMVGTSGEAARQRYGRVGTNVASGFAEMSGAMVAGEAMAAAAMAVQGNLGAKPGVPTGRTLKKAAGKTAGTTKKAASSGKATSKKAAPPKRRRKRVT